MDEMISNADVLVAIASEGLRCHKKQCDSRHNERHQDGENQIGKSHRCVHLCPGKRSINERPSPILPTTNQDQRRYRRRQASPRSDVDAHDHSVTFGFMAVRALRETEHGRPFTRSHQKDIAKLPAYWTGTSVNLAQRYMKLRTQNDVKVTASAASPLRASKHALSIMAAKTLATPSRHKVPYLPQSVLEREYKILMHYVRYVRSGRSGIGEVKDANRGVAGYLRHRRETARVAFTRHRFKALAAPTKIVLVPAEKLVCKLSYDLDIYYGDILSGDWDIHRSIDMTASAKHRAIHERFVLNIPWEETELFQSAYAVRFARGEVLRGADNVRDLALEYTKRVDSLYHDMKLNGFVIATDDSGRPKALPHVHIGRDGQILFGNNGNHRLAIAKIIGLSEIPCWVRGRHSQWQELREEVAATVKANAPISAPDSIADHPDLKDLLDASAPAQTSVPE